MIVLAAVLGAVAAAAAFAWLRLRKRMELVARAAHELRSPLCAARLAVHAAGREGGWPSVAAVDRELARAALALEDLGAARRGRRAPDRMERVDVMDLLHDVRHAWSPLAWPLRREVRVEPSAQTLLVHGDRLRLAQALGNLVGNALEHGRGPVVLRARATPAGRVRVEVEDRGDGRAAPVGTLARGPRGGRGDRGRGLAITRGIAERHGGTLRAEHTTGGCRLVLELVEARGRGAAAGTAPRGSRPGGRRLPVRRPGPRPGTDALRGRRSSRSPIGGRRPPRPAPPGRGPRAAGGRPQRPQRRRWRRPGPGRDGGPRRQPWRGRHRAARSSPVRDRRGGHGREAGR